LLASSICPVSLVASPSAIDHAFASGFDRIEFTVDARNKRSCAAVLKLGATHEGTLRRNRITWTGYVRDTCVFGLLREEWESSRA